MVQAEMVPSLLWGLSGPLTPTSWGGRGGSGVSASVVPGGKAPGGLQGEREEHTILGEGHLPFWGGTVTSPLALGKGRGSPASFSSGWGDVGCFSLENRIWGL